MDPSFIIAGLAVAEIQERTAGIETEREMRRTMTLTRQSRFGRVSRLLHRRQRSRVTLPAPLEEGCPSPDCGEA